MMLLQRHLLVDGSFMYADCIPHVLVPQKAGCELTRANCYDVQVLDDLVERLPDQFDMEDIRGRVDEFTPYVMVAIQVTLTTKQLQGCTTLMPIPASSTSSTSTTSKPTNMYLSMRRIHAVNFGADMLQDLAAACRCNPKP